MFFVLLALTYINDVAINNRLGLGLGISDLLTTLYIITACRILVGVCTYTKAKYLVVVLISLGFIFFELGVNFLVPVFYSLEAGTILFVIVIIKSFINFWKEQGRALWYSSVLVFSVLTVPTTPLPQLANRLDPYYTDFIDGPCSVNEFFLIALPLSKNQINILYITLFYVIISTGFIIAGKQSLLLPSKLINQPTLVNVFQKIKEIVFSYSKNMVYPFSPN